MESFAELIESELREAVEVKNEKSLHRYVLLLTENVVSRQKHSDEFNSLKSDIREMIAFISERFGTVDKRFEDTQKNVNTRFEDLQSNMNTRFENMQNNMNTRFEDMQNNMNTRFEGMQNNMNTRFIDMQSNMDKRFTMMFRFMTTGFVLLALIMSLYQFLG